MREALINAICHRSYFVESPIFVEIYPDRLQIVNAGGLLPGMTLSDLGKKSRTRNRKVFGLMQRTHLVEKAGTGIIRIREAMKNYQLPHPKIEANSDWFAITFKRPDLQKESYEQRFYGTAQKTAPKTTPKTTPKTEELILEAINQNTAITKEKLAEQLGISAGGIKYHIKKLHQKKKLAWKGPSKGGHWEVNYPRLKA